MLTNKQFDQARSLALSLAGIELTDRHREILSRRTSRLGIAEDRGLDELLSMAESGDEAARRRLLTLFTTTVTAFFRNPSHFDVAAEHALCIASQRPHVRCWSAAASSGQEAYSLAIALTNAFAQEAPPFSILATDIDEIALEIARQAEYSDRDVAELEPALLQRFFTPSVRHHWAIRPETRCLVQVSRLNLIDVAWHNVNGPFDLIFCRNVLMYLETSHRYAVAERMASLLASDGLLFLDPAEHLGIAGHFFQLKTDGVYMRRRASR